MKQLSSRFHEVIIPSEHEFTLVFGGLVVEIGTEEGGSINVRILGFNSCAILCIVMHLFPLVQEEVFIMFIMRNTTKLCILFKKGGVLSCLFNSKFFTSIWLCILFCNECCVQLNKFWAILFVNNVRMKENDHLNDEVPVLHICFPFLHMQPWNNRMLTRILWYPAGKEDKFWMRIIDLFCHFSNTCLLHKLFSRTTKFLKCMQEPVRGQTA